MVYKNYCQLWPFFAQQQIISIGMFFFAMLQEIISPTVSRNNLLSCISTLVAVAFSFAKFPKTVVTPINNLFHLQLFLPIV